MVKKLIFVLTFMIISFNFAFASSVPVMPYGPGYGFCANPDLGLCETLEQVKQKVSYEWCLNRADGLIKSLFLSGSLDYEKVNQFKTEIANQLYSNYNCGNIKPKQLPYGSIIIGISSGSGWSFNRRWVGKDPLDYWENTVILNIGKDKVVLRVGLIMRCGNEGLVGVDTLVYTPERPPVDVPQEQPPEKVELRPLFQATRMAEGSTNSVSTYSSMGISFARDNSINFNINNASKSISSADVNNYNYVLTNIINDITMIQQQLTQILINNQNQNIDN